jgi:hypothetical protein
MESTSAAAPASGLMTLDTWLAAAEGDASGAWTASVLGDVLFPEMFTWGQYAAAGSVDSAAARGYFASPPAEGYDNLGYAASSFVWGGGRLAEAWPAAAGVESAADSQIETLHLGEQLSTPADLARPAACRTDQVVLRARAVDFWSHQTEAGERLITTFFDTGAVDDTFTPVKPDFTPAMTHASIGKIAAGSMVGLALIALLSLLWMPAHVGRRGGFGPKTGAVLRSVFPVVLGLGGWCLGALVVLTTIPSVAIDGVILGTLGTGVPVGFGVYLTWVQRGWSGSTKASGFIAATAGGLVGAWLGFLAARG